MFTDPMTVKLPLDATDTFSGAASSFAIRDITLGGSVRRNTSLRTEPVDLSFSHQVTVENKPTLTDRARVRVEGRYPNSITGAELVVSASIVVAIPREAGGYDRALECLLLAISAAFVADDGTIDLSSAGRAHRFLTGEA